MNIISIVLSVIIAGLSLAFMNRPFRQKEVKGHKRLEGGKQHQTRKDAVLSALRDLDFDFKTGKVIDEDYSPVRAQLLAEAARLTQQEQEKEDQLEALIQNRRNRGRVDACEKCGTAIAAGQRFCSNCGSPVKSETCPSCSSNIKTGDLFCSTCGKPLEFQATAIGHA